MSADISKIVDQLSGLTLLEASELVKALEEKWGVKAATGGGGGAVGAPAPVPPPPA